MEKKYSYKYDSKSGIMFKNYYGLITMKDIYSSWDDAIKNKLIPEGTRRFVLDYREATFDFKISESPKIAEYYKAHLEVFQNCKFAIVAQKPKDVVVPAIVETHDDGYLSKPFYTKEAAINWVLDDQYSK